MSIRPLDMQVMVPRLTEVSRLSQIQQEKGHVNQEQIANNLGKEQEKDKRGIVKSKGHERMNNHADSKEKGNGQYVANRSKKKSDKKEKGRETESIHKIDIRI